MNPTTLSTAFPKTSDSFIESLRLLNQSPNDPAVFKTPSRSPVKLPSNLTMPEPTFLIKVKPISRTENNPLKIDFTFSACSSLSFKLAVKSRIRSVNLYNCSPVTGGNISRKASLMGAITLIKPLNEFHKACIIFSLPEGLLIFSTNSSIDMLPSFKPSDKFFISLTWSLV